MHWQKLNRLPIAPPSKTTSQFFPWPNLEMEAAEACELDHDSKYARQA